MVKVALVTGSNKGIGYAIVRGLCKQFDGDVILAARDGSRGLAAVSSLEKEGLHPKFHQLDITNQESIDQLKVFIAETYGGLDVLVNNAGMFVPPGDKESAEVAKTTIRVNYFGTLAVLQTMMPILNSGARVVNLAGGLASVVFRKSSPARKKVICDAASVHDVTDVMNNYVQSVKDGVLEQEGWPVDIPKMMSPAYCIGKMGINMLSPITQKMIDADTSRSDILINACCPGATSTDMYRGPGGKTIDEGADTPLYVALLPPNVPEPRGQHVFQRKILEWMKHGPSCK
ncbi:hypothetical protein CAPTEDRAFT_152583 [Capitella teleta]|uniref:Carbonyl reductase [NADPH] 1 n=1 Tax=Capitella teleta TaxID=283909 RepID=R7VBM7_CAPTE|nr:hypothetical protein CAPTEDRAFT_152583 [Capitella teleta]|eukprot:ELU15972.1 hypothetical protein CAPTEDRAFT_152583 [Capitella teleta]